MSGYSIILIALSILPCVLSFWAAGILWSNKAKLPGSLYPAIFCFTNGLYGVVFTGLLIISSLGVSQSRVQMIVIWILIYLLQQVTYSMMALFFIGKIDDRWLRRLLRVK